ncbi:unnamed protein product [Sphenostylis stenocarpa]|uniref:EF-hand domain-containing protein n=1 Tax=Sphenostylis stenocarpa TaxID=92480 RepID=A0AA86VUZ3_9FABA|nr:unnamed protein product [Sphenostylis stenocarpa]
MVIYHNGQLHRSNPSKPGKDSHKDVPNNLMMQKIMEKLKEADRDKDGCYNKDELKHALRELGAFFPGWRANRALEKFDANNDGQISGQEIDDLIEYLRSRGFGK